MTLPIWDENSNEPYSGFSKVPGMCSKSSAAVLAACLEWQHFERIEGNICEIGTYFGRSFGMFCQYLRAGETAIGIDLYDHEGAKESVEHLARRNLPNGAEAVVIKASSLSLPEETERYFDQSSRFIHVDGGHDLYSARADLARAARIIGQGGVIVIDDFFSMGYPEVTEATFDFLQLNRNLLCVVAIIEGPRNIRDGGPKMIVAERRNANALFKHLYHAFASTELSSAEYLGDHYLIIQQSEHVSSEAFGTEVFKRSSAEARTREAISRSCTRSFYGHASRPSIP